MKYVHTDTDLMIMEKGAKGKKNIVLGYVLSLGTQGSWRDDGDMFTCGLRGGLRGVAKALANKPMIYCWTLCFHLVAKEHRAFMETAYAYGSKYQFILITGGPVLKYLG